MKVLPQICQALALAALLAFSTQTARAVVYQWSVPIDSTPSHEIDDQPRAFLWLPDHCARVRAVVVAQHNMLEEDIIDTPYFRQTLSDLGFGVIWITPNIDPVFNFNAGAGEKFDAMMKDLAGVSGYRELAYAPIVPIGHSACASYPWNFAAWNPARTLAILSVHGDAPLTNRTGSGRPNPDWGNRTIDGVPGLFVMGEYEWHDDRLQPALDFRTQHPATALSMLADAGNGHFNASDDLVHYLALYLRKAAALRLPSDASLDAAVPLKPVDPVHTGWLAERWHPDQSPPSVPAAPVAEYKGDPRQAFWFFDREIAQATEKYAAAQRGKLPQQLGFRQDGQPVPERPGSFALYYPKFEPLADGISFHLTGMFVDKVLSGGPDKVLGLPAGTSVGHVADGAPIVISRICGPVEKTGPDTFSVAFYRMGISHARSSGDIWLVATQPGDAKYKRAVQQANMSIPLTDDLGPDQHLTFPQIPDQPATTKMLQLTATSDAGLPVHYYVREGPAEIDGTTLKFTPIPPRSKFPLAVTIVAWQYGRSLAPPIKTAAPIEQTFHLKSP